MAILTQTSGSSNSSSASVTNSAASSSSAQSSAVISDQLEKVKTELQAKEANRDKLEGIEHGIEEAGSLHPKAAAHMEANLDRLRTKIGVDDTAISQLASLKQGLGQISSLSGNIPDGTKVSPPTAGTGASSSLMLS